MTKKTRDLRRQVSPDFDNISWFFQGNHCFPTSHWFLHMRRCEELVSSFRCGPTLHMTLRKVATFPVTQKKGEGNAFQMQPPMVFPCGRGGRLSRPSLPWQLKNPVIKTLAYVLICGLFEYSHWSNRKDEQKMRNCKSKIYSKRTSKVLY